MSKSLKQKTIIGIVWSFFSQIGTEITAFIVGIILARLLTPEDYGLLGMVVIFVGFSNVFINYSFGPAIVQKKELTSTDLSSIFWTNLALGSFFSLLLITFSGLISDFFEEPRLKIISIILAFGFIVGSSNVVHRAILEREMNYKVIAKAKVFSSLVSGSVALILAYNGWGYWSLVAHSLLLIVMEATVLWLNNNWMPRFIFEKNSIKSVSKFSINLLGERSLGHFTETFDRLLIGKFSGGDELGLYNKGWAGVMFPLKNIALVVSKVIFSTISSIQDDKAKVGRLFVKAISAVCFITIPLLSGVFFLSEELVGFVYGEQWLPMVPYLKIFSLMGVVSSIFAITLSVFTGLGRTDIMFKISLVEKPIFILCIILGYYFFGAKGAAMGLLIASAGTLIFRQYWIYRLTTIPISEHYKPIFIILIPTTVMLLTLGLINYMASGVGEFLYLLISFILGVLIYFITSYLMKIAIFLEFLEYLKDYRTKRL